VLLQSPIIAAKALVIATPETIHLRLMTKMACQLKPDIQIVVRSHNVQEAALIQQEAGATVFVGETELANSVVAHVLRLLKAA